MQLIEVAFKGNRREFFHWPADEPPPLKAPVIVEADRGEDLGVVHALGELAQRRWAGVAHGEKAAAPPRPALRLASADEQARARELRTAEDEDARRRAMERVRAHGLIMKLTDAEWQWDRKKLTFYFTAERRVDFRGLVRDLAAAFRTRIELRQIGVRDEARRLDGIGRCGRQYCSASWLPELRPVNLGVAKDQRLSLNPLQISGACGRLMCCLRYEHEFYVQSRKRFPKEGKILVTRVGEEKVLANDIFRDRVTLRSAEGETRVVALADLKQEIANPTGRDDDDDAIVETAPADGADAADVAGDARRPRTTPGSRELPVRDPMRDPMAERPSSRPIRAPRGRDAARPALDHRGRAAHDAETSDDAARAREDDADADIPHPGAEAAVIPLDTPEAVEADAQRVRADLGELPADGDITGAGADRRRRRRGRRGGRRGRGARGDGSATESGDAGDPGEADGADAGGDHPRDDGGA